MATTKIWAVKDSLSRVVNYASNPDKTIISDLENVILYATDNDKTEKEETMFVTGVNCNRETAFEEMMMTQKVYDKCTGNIAYHAYQSFKTGEVTPELAHKIGVELAQKMWPSHQVLVATHFNTGTYHNHFVVNSVNMYSGKKFNCNKGAYYHFRELSDRLCEKYELTVIKNPKGRTARNIYFAEKRGEPTKYNLMRQEIDEAMKMCISYGQFKKIMYKKVYVINDDYNRKYTTIRSIYDKKAVRMYHLGEKYKISNIKNVVEHNPYYYQNRYMELFHSKKEVKYKKYRYKGSFKSISKKSGLEILFITLFYFMGILPKEKTRYKPLSPEIKAEVRKMERYSNQIRLVCSQKLENIDDVKKYIKDKNVEIDQIIAIRQKYRNKLRHCKDEELIESYKKKISECSCVIKKYRANVKIANQIIEDVPKVREIIRIEKERNRQENEIIKTKKKSRYR